MSPSLQLNTVLREWAEFFIGRSMRDFMRFVKASGLSMPQFSVLMRLYYQGACGVSDIGAHLDVTNAAASQMIDRLVQAGLIHRAEFPTDRRVRQLTLTPKGRALAEKAIRARNRWTEGLSTVLTHEQQATIAAALKDLIEAARKLDLEGVAAGGTA